MDKQYHSDQWPPVVHCVEDVRAAVEAARDVEIREVEHGLLCVDQASRLVPTPDSALLRECRSMMFDASTGRIAARPPHYWPTYGADPDEDAGIPVGEGYVITEKRDGALFFPARLGSGEVVWCARGGRNELAARIERDCEPDVLEAYGELTVGFGKFGALTPCFEFTCPWNPTIVRHAQSELALFAIRETVSGRYLTPEEIDGLRRAWRELTGASIAVCRGLSRLPPLAGGRLPTELRAAIGRPRGRPRKLAYIASRVRDSETLETGRRPTTEGVVVAFDSGYRTNIRTSAYEELRRERMQICPWERE